MPWGRYDQVTCSDLDSLDERAWLPAARMLAARVRPGGQLISEHDVATAGLLHPLFAVAGLSADGTEVSHGRERAHFRRTQPLPSRLTELRLRLRSVRRVPEALPVTAAEAELTTGRVTGGDGAGAARIVVRVHNRPVGVVHAPTPITPADLSSLAQVAASSPTPSAGAAMPLAGADTVEFRAGPPFGSTTTADWLVLSHFVLDEADRRRAIAAIRSFSGAGIVALIGSRLPAACPDTRIGRWLLHEQLSDDAALDGPTRALSRLAGSGYVALHRSAADAGSRLDRAGVIATVAGLVAAGRAVRVCPGLIATGPAWRRHQPLAEALATAWRLGQAERVVGQRFGPMGTDRRSEFAGGSTAPMPPAGLAAALAVTATAARGRLGWAIRR